MPAMENAFFLITFLDQNAYRDNGFPFKFLVYSYKADLSHTEELPWIYYPSSDPTVQQTNYT